MKKIIVLCFVVLFSYQAKSQYVDWEHPSYPIDSFTFVDSGYYPAYDTNVVYTGTIPQMTAFSKVFYSSKPVVYLKVDEQDYSSTLFYIMDSLGSSTLIFPSSNEFTLTSLLFNRSYLVYAVNELSDSVPIYSFRTERNIDPDVLEISRGLFDSLRFWSKYDTLPLGTKIRNLSGVHNLEKISLLQQFYMDSMAQIPDLYLTGFLIPDNTVFNKKPTCNCKMAMTAPIKGEISPGAFKNGSIWGVANPPETAEQDNGIWQDLLWVDVVGQGPSKLVNAKFSGRGGTTDQKYPVVTKLTSGTPYYASRVIGYFCTDNNDYSSSCGCERTINVKYLYQSKLTAHAETNWCATCLGRSATAQIDDAAFIIVRNDITEETTFLDGEVQQAYAENKESVNKEFLIEFTDATFDFGVPLVISLAATSATGVPIITPGLIDSAKSFLQALINLPPPYNSSTSGASLVYFNSLFGAQNFTIAPGEALIVTMHSYHQAYFTGKGMWNSNATIASNFLISLRHKGGFNGPTQECCGPNVGSWVLSTQEGKAPSNYNNLHNSVELHLQTIPGWWSTPSIGIDYGTLIGNPGWRCYTEVFGKKDPNSATIDVQISNAKLFVQLNEKGEEKSLEGNSFEIIDMTGKVISSGTVEKNGYLIDLNIGFPTLVILRVYSGEKVYSEKLGIIYSGH